jgi:hypothetical protein
MLFIKPALRLAACLNAVKAAIQLTKHTVLINNKASRLQKHIYKSYPFYGL